MIFLQSPRAVYENELKIGSAVWKHSVSILRTYISHKLYFNSVLNTWINLLGLYFYHFVECFGGYHKKNQYFKAHFVVSGCLLVKVSRFFQIHNKNKT